MNDWNSDHRELRKSDLIVGVIVLAALILLVVFLLVGSASKNSAYRGVDPGGANYMDNHDSLGPGSGGTWIGN